MLDIATITVTASGGLGTQVFSVPAGGVLPPFSTVQSVGVIAKDTVYTYTFVIDAGGGCTKTDTPLNLLGAAYPTSSAFTLTEQMTSVANCSYADVNFHLVDAVDGTNLPAGTIVNVTGGPLAIPVLTPRIVTTDALGKGSLRVRAGAANYSYSIPAQNGRAAVAATTFSVPSTTAVTVPDIAVPWPMKTITVQLNDGFTAGPVNGDAVTISGGPTTKIYNGVTNPAGQYIVSVPYGTGFPDYTITVPPDAAGRLGVTGTTPSITGNVTVTLVDPWTMMPVNVTLTDAFTGAAFGLRTVQLTGGPPSAPISTYTTDAAGLVTISVPAGAGPNYTLTVPAQVGHNAIAATFSPVGPGPVAVAIAVPWPMNDLVVTVTGSVTTLPLAGRTVHVSAGPAAFSPPDLVTDAFGRVTFSLPVGATAYTIFTPVFGAFPSATVNKVVTATPVPNVQTLTVVGA
jgi:hypothetical protein